MCKTQQALFHYLYKNPLNRTAVLLTGFFCLHFASIACATLFLPQQFFTA